MHCTKSTGTQWTRRHRGSHPATAHGSIGQVRVATFDSAPTRTRLPPPAATRAPRNGAPCSLPWRSRPGSSRWLCSLGTSCLRRSLAPVPPAKARSRRSRPCHARRRRSRLRMCSHLPSHRRRRRRRRRRRHRRRFPRRRRLQHRLTCCATRSATRTCSLAFAQKPALRQTATGRRCGSIGPGLAGPRGAPSRASWRRPSHPHHRGRRRRPDCRRHRRHRDRRHLVHPPPGTATSSNCTRASVVARTVFQVTRLRGTRKARLQMRASSCTSSMGGSRGVLATVGAPRAA